MNDSPSHFALRQWGVQFSNPATLLILAAVATLLAILGPFETGLRLTFIPRLAYWAIMAATTYSIGMLVNTWLLRALPHSIPLPLRVGIAGIATGLAVTPVVVAINYVTFAYVPSAQDWPALLLQFFAISVIISVIFHAVSATQPDTPTSTPVKTPPLLDRLPLDKRGALIALSSEDHYTRIRTTKGDDLILIRLSDAIREAAPTPGLRVHRSHWIALDQVKVAQRDGDRATLSMTQGGDIPVSRTNIAAVRNAGLLPQ